MSGEAVGFEKGGIVGERMVFVEEDAVLIFFFCFSFGIGAVIIRRLLLLLVAHGCLFDLILFLRISKAEVANFVDGPCLGRALDDGVC